MKKLLLLVFSIALLLPSGEAFARKSHHARDSVDPVFGVRHHRPHVVIHKHYRTGAGTQITRPQAIGILAFVAPPLAVFYDLQRRTNCQGDVLGLGGPGFSSPITPATGNVMTTAYMRGECANAPTPRY